MKRLSIPSLILAAALAAACAQDRPTTLEPTDAVFNNGRGGGGGGESGSVVRHQLRFVAYDNNGAEITSDLFPADGVVLNTKDPWKDLEVPNATWSFNNYTHGSVGQGTCTFNKKEGVVWMNWDIPNTAGRTFEGDWEGTISFWRNRGMNFYMVGNRSDNPEAVIQNIASNFNRNNVDEHTGSATDEWEFAIEFTNAGLGFGGASDPDGDGPLSELDGYEAACANFRVEAVRMPSP